MYMMYLLILVTSKHVVECINCDAITMNHECKSRWKRKTADIKLKIITGTASIIYIM